MQKVSDKKITNTTDLGALEDVTKDFEIFKCNM